MEQKIDLSYWPMFHIIARYRVLTSKQIYELFFKMYEFKAALRYNPALGTDAPERIISERSAGYRISTLSKKSYLGRLEFSVDRKRQVGYYVRHRAFKWCEEQGYQHGFPSIPAELQRTQEPNTRIARHGWVRGDLAVAAAEIGWFVDHSPKAREIFHEAYGFEISDGAVLPYDLMYHEDKGALVILCDEGNPKTPPSQVVLRLPVSTKSRHRLRVIWRPGGLDPVWSKSKKQWVTVGQRGRIIEMALEKMEQQKLLKLRQDLLGEAGHLQTID